MHHSGRSSTLLKQHEEIQRANDFKSFYFRCIVTVIAYRLQACIHKNTLKNLTQNVTYLPA